MKGFEKMAKPRPAKEEEVKYAYEYAAEKNININNCEIRISGAGNIVCCQPFACLPNHIVGKGVIKELRAAFPEANIIAVDYDPGASEVNQLNRIKLMLATANKNL